MSAVFETNHRAETTMRHHRHGSPFVTVVLRGGYVEVGDAAPTVCLPGSLVIHDASEEHADRFSADTRCLNVELSELPGTPYPRSVMPDTPKLSSAVETLVRSYYVRGDDVPASVENLQAALRDAFSAPSPNWPNWVEHVIDAFAWAEPIPLREAAAMVGLHETHFSRAFRRHVGMTANEYRARVRMRVASRLLLTTTHSLARVALSAGFSDQSHLTRAFSRTLGLSPAGYRRTFAR
jgi:AraC-like DNA-binding protein